MDNRERARASDWKQRRRILLEEKRENFIAAVRKWEILAASKVSDSEKIKENMNTGDKILGKHIRQFLHKIMCNWEVWRFSRIKRHCSRAKQRQRKTKMRVARANRPLPSPKNPHFQNEARCTTFLVKWILFAWEWKNDFHIKGWAPTFVLKQRPGKTRKWPICLFF